MPASDGRLETVEYSNMAALVNSRPKALRSLPNVLVMSRKRPPRSKKLSSKAHSFDPKNVPEHRCKAFDIHSRRKRAEQRSRCEVKPVAPGHDSARECPAVAEPPPASAGWWTVGSSVGPCHRPSESATMFAW